MNKFDYKSFIDTIWFERRDIVSDGYDRALEYISEIIPEMEIFKYPSGSEAWTWIIPEKWSVSKAYIKDGEKFLLDLNDHPLHVMSYSLPISGKVSKAELLKHLYTRPELPDAIPFEFSYYQKKWGFCLEHSKLGQLTNDEYEVLIESKFEPGELKVGSMYHSGKIDREIVIIAHLCHPCMVNDDLSGVSVLVSLAKKFQSMSDLYYSYRFLILPETIGSIAFLSHNEYLIEKIEFGIFLEMLGHQDNLSLQKSKQGNTHIDKAAEIVLKESGEKYRIGDFHQVIGNDEKVFNGPGVNIPTISISRSKFFGEGEWPYPQYHSSADTPKIISIDRLKEAESITQKILFRMDQNYYPIAKVKGPIFLSRYNLWVDWRDDRELNAKQAAVLDYLHEHKSLLEIAYELDISYEQLKYWLDKFYDNGLIEKRKPVAG